MLRNPDLSSLIPRRFFVHFVKRGPGNTQHQRCARARGHANIAFFKGAYALLCYVLGLVMLTSNTHQHNCGYRVEV